MNGNNESPNNRELSEKIADIREWLVRIDTKVDNLNEVKRTAEDAKSTADRAWQKSDDNAKAIDGIKKVAMWAITSLIAVGGLTITIAIAVFG